MRLVHAVALSLGVALVGCGGAGRQESPDGVGGMGGVAGSGGGIAGSGGSTAGEGGAGGVGGARGATAIDGGVDAGQAGARAPDAADANDAGAAAEAGVPVPVAVNDSCAPIPIDAPAAEVTNLDNGTAIDEAGFLGGEIPSGTYVLSRVVHFGASYDGPTKALWVVDADAKTLEAASLDGETATYVSYAFANASPAVLSGFPSCGASAPSNWNYLVTNAGATLSVNLRGSNDVLLFTRKPPSEVRALGVTTSPSPGP
jgi:hypothetical protein